MRLKLPSIKGGRSQSLPQEPHDTQENISLQQHVGSSKTGLV